MDAKINGMIFKGVHINNLVMKDYEFKLLEFERPVTPALSYEAVNVPNRDGAYYFKNNYENSTCSVKLGIHGTSAVKKQQIISNILSKWIQSEGRLIFLDRPNLFYKAYIFESVSQDMGDYWTEVDITFNTSFALYQLYGDARDYFAADKTKIEDIDVFVNKVSWKNITDTLQASVNNSGNYKTLPVIYFFGTAELINFTMGDTAFSLSGLNNSFVYIDCEKMTVYTIVENKKVSLLTSFSGNFPQISVGDNNFVVSGRNLNLTEIRIEFPNTFIA